MGEVLVIIASKHETLKSKPKAGGERPPQGKPV